MYSRNSFGSYYPIDSIIHKLNPTLKLINFLIIFLLCILCNSIYICSFMFILILIMQVLSFVPLKYYFNTFWSLRILYLLIVLPCIYFSLSIEQYIIIILRVVSFVEYLNIICYTTSSSENIYGIEKFLSLFNIFYLPLSKLSFKINSLLRYYPLVLNVKYKTYKACASRGIDYSNSNIISKMFIRLNLDESLDMLTSEKSKQISLNSELRLYDSLKYRTNYRKNNITFNDFIFLGIHVLLVICYLVDGGLI